MDRRGDFRRCYRLDPQDFLLIGAAVADEAGDEEKRKAVEKVLGEPIFDDFSDNTLKIRRNLLVVAYLVVHFGWNSITHFQQWRLRVTGTRLAFKTGRSPGLYLEDDERGDYPDDPRQSTLYTWWLVQAKQLASNPETPDGVMSSERIHPSLDRFDRWFRLFQWNQVARWLVIEWGLPLALGVWAIWLAWPYGRPWL